MSDFLKIAAGILVGLILWVTVSKSNKDISVLLTMAVCAMICIAGLAYLRPVLSFMEKLKELGGLDEDLFALVMKVVGIGLIAELSMLICKDAGNESMGKALQILSAFVVLCMSVPVFEKLMSLLDTILGSI